MGLVIFAALGLYLLISIGVVAWAIWYARKHNKNIWLWGFGAAFIMYNLVFWDWIPTVVAHKYYCSSEAGFWVYKTLDQWKAENPGVLEGLVREDAHFISEQNVSSYTSVPTFYRINSTGYA